MKQSQCSVGMVITIGRKDRNALAACVEPNKFRWLRNGEMVDPDDFRAGWDLFIPELPDHPEVLAEYIEGYTVQLSREFFPDPSRATAPS